MIDFAAVQQALSDRLRATAGLATLLYENAETPQPIPQQAYVSSAFAPGTVTVTTAIGPTLSLEATGVLKVLYHGLKGRGAAGNQTAVTAIVTQFAGWRTSLGNGDTLRIRTDLLPAPGGSYEIDGGWFVTPISVFWLVQSHLTTS